MEDIIDFGEKFKQKLKPGEAGLANESETDQPRPAEDGPDAGALDDGEADLTEAEEGQHQEAEMEAAEEAPCKSRNQVDQIIDLAGKQVDFFHTADGNLRDHQVRRPAADLAGEQQRIQAMDSAPLLHGIRENARRRAGSDCHQPV